MRILTAVIISAFLITRCYLSNTDEPVCNFVGFKYYNDELDTLGELSNDYILIGSDSSNTDQEISGFIASQSTFDSEYEFTIHQYPNYAYKHTALKFTKSLSCEDITGSIKSFKKSPVVDYAHYAIQTDNCRNLIGEKIGEKCVNSYSSLFYVKIPNANDTTALYKTADETKTDVLHRNKFRENWFTLSADKKSTDDALHMANYFYETGLFEAAEPDVIKLPVE